MQNGGNSELLSGACTELLELSLSSMLLVCGAPKEPTHMLPLLAHGKPSVSRHATSLARPHTWQAACNATQAMSLLFMEWLVS